ncbi:MAG: glycosidase [Planctomycetota bacterium]
MPLQRHPENPIVTPGGPYWRSITTFNPGVVIHDGTFYMLERACSSLAPLYCQFGLLKSDDGVHFELASNEPVFTAEQLGTPKGTVEDPRLVQIGDTFYMTYVHRNYVASCFPNGQGVPDYHNPTFVPPGDPNNYRTGIATSTDLLHWEDLGLVTPPDVDDRDCTLFPEKIGGRFAMLRRPMHYVGQKYGCDRPSIWLSYSDDLKTWSEPHLIAAAEHPDWEAVKIGGAAQPLRTEEGWLLLYHGVDRAGVYRVGAMLLDLHDPTRLIARTPEWLMQPEEYYERVGLIIPRVIFPSANVIRDGTVYVYYGCCDTCISLATARLADLLAAVLEHKR